jgi:hypothetical protein
MATGETAGEVVGAFSAGMVTDGATDAVVVAAGDGSAPATGAAVFGNTRRTGATIGSTRFADGAFCGNPSTGCGAVAAVVTGRDTTLATCGELAALGDAATDVGGAASGLWGGGCATVSIDDGDTDGAVPAMNCRADCGRLEVSASKTAPVTAVATAPVSKCDARELTASLPQRAFGRAASRGVTSRRVVSADMASTRPQK